MKIKNTNEIITPNSCFIYSKFFMYAAGAWPYATAFRKILFRWLWITPEFILFVSEVIKLIEIRRNMDLVLEAISLILYNRAVDVKFFNLVINEHKFKNLLEKMKMDWNSLSDKKEIQILVNYTSLGRLFNLIYICMIYPTLLLCMILPLTPVIMDVFIPLNESRPRRPLFMVEFFIDEEKYFFSILTHNYITALLCPLALLASDLFYMNCAFHVCGIITIIGTRLDNVLKDKLAVKNSNEGKYKLLCGCIEMHQRVYDFCDDINSAYSSSFLIVLFFSMTLMSFTGVATVIKLDDLSQVNEIIRFGIFTVAQIVHLLCFNFMGQSILNAMEKLYDNIYNTEWYEAPIKTQTLIKYMLLRNAKPTVMQAVLFPLNLPTFTSVMKTSMSYFTVIKSTR